MIEYIQIIFFIILYSIKGEESHQQILNHLGKLLISFLILAATLTRTALRTVAL